MHPADSVVDRRVRVGRSLVQSAARTAALKCAERLALVAVRDDRPAAAFRSEPAELVEVDAVARQFGGGDPRAQRRSVSAAIGHDHSRGLLRRPSTQRVASRSRGFAG